MILALDVHYRENFAQVVCAEFTGWKDIDAKHFNTAVIDEFGEYIPGEFYKRELPCLLHILEAYDLDLVNCIVIDGYVFLDDNGRKGLGAYLYDALNGKIPVIGLAKSGFYTSGKQVRKILRGNSSKPLYITSDGIDPDTAAELIAEMSGSHRIPDILREVDQRTKR